jgi:membrane-associated phospholipid phosphatase
MFSGLHRFSVKYSPIASPSGDMKLAFRFWLGGLAITIVVVLISITWIDRPVALMIHATVRPPRLPAEAGGSSIFSIPLVATFVFAIFGLSASLGRKFSKPEWAIILCDISVLAAESIKNQLKFAFGRAWPDSWGPEAVSLIRDNIYGFHFFHPGESYQSFPSGHAAVVAAVMSVLWILFPRVRVVCAVCILAADTGLVLLNLHFVSDVVAGTFVGISAGMFTVALSASAIQNNPRAPIS